MATAFQFRLDTDSGVPVYRQIIDRVLTLIAAGSVRAGDQLPTVRQVAVDLAINPNTVMRAYKELEIRGTLKTQQGLGTFIAPPAKIPDSALRDQRLTKLAGDCASRAGAEGFSVEELVRRLAEIAGEQDRRN